MGPLVPLVFLVALSVLLLYVLVTPVPCLIVLVDFLVLVAGLLVLVALWFLLFLFALAAYSGLALGYVALVMVSFVFFGLGCCWALFLLVLGLLGSNFCFGLFEFASAFRNFVVLLELARRRSEFSNFAMLVIFFPILTFICFILARRSIKVWSASSQT